MRGNSAPLKIGTHDLIPSDMHTPLNSLWSTGPSSPPFHPVDRDDRSLASSPASTLSEFEFDLLSSLNMKDDPPVSPKLIAASSVAKGFWTPSPAVSSPFHPLPPAVSTPVQPVAPPAHRICSTKQPSAPPSPSISVRQLLAEDTSSEHDNDLDLDFFSAPQTPMWTPARNSDPDPKQRRLSHDEPYSRITTEASRRKSSSIVLERHGTAHVDEVAARKNQVLQLSKSEPNSQFAMWASSYAWEKSEEERREVKRQGSKSCMKWAFKDLLRKTVPSSKAEAHYITKIMGASSSKKHLSSSKSNPNVSSLASPMHPTSMSTPHASRPSTPGRSPVHGSSTPTRSPPRRPSTPGRLPSQTINWTPTPSPPRSPLSPHAAHYQQNKAQSQELTRKTFLPYRQSLLGCLGGPGAFPSEQQAW